MTNRESHSIAVKGLTMMEMIISLAIIAVIFAVTLPQFRNIENSWASKQATAEAIQNGRILISYLNQNLATAAQITAVSDPCDTTGYIEFEGNDAVTYRCEIGADNIVEFGPVGSLVDLAGPVSQLQFTCYDIQDLDTPITTVGDIRSVKVQVTLSNAGPGQDQNFTASAFLRTNSSSGRGMGGHWRLDEASGLTAADSSGNDNDGTLTNMAGDEWTTGILANALEFDGINDYIALPYILNPDDGDFTATAWIYLENEDPDDPGNVVLDQTNNGVELGRIWLSRHNDTDALLSRFGGEQLLTSDTLDLNRWYHVGVVYEKGASATKDGIVKMYIDGEEKASDDTYQDACTGSMRIGRGRINNREWDGIIDDVRIYNRALTAEEIAALADPDRVIFREFTETKVDTDVPSITLSTPAGTSEGDLMIAAVVTDGETTTQILPPGGEGWTEIDLDESGNAVTLGVWWKLADALESPTHQFTWTNNFQQAYGLIMRFTGHDPSDPINDSEVEIGNSSTPISPSVTTTVANTLILRLGAFDDDDIIVANTGLSGHTDITMDKSSSIGNPCSGGAGYVPQAAIGDSGTSNFSLTAGEQHVTVTVAIAPDPSMGDEILP